MGKVQHSQSLMEENHCIHSFVFNSIDSMISSSGYTTNDIGKIALVYYSDIGFYMLTSLDGDSGLWTHLTGGPLPEWLAPKNYISYFNEFEVYDNIGIKVNNSFKSVESFLLQTIELQKIGGGFFDFKPEYVRITFTIIPDDSSCDIILRNNSHDDIGHASEVYSFQDVIANQDPLEPFSRLSIRGDNVYVTQIIVTDIEFSGNTLEEVGG